MSARRTASGEARDRIDERALERYRWDALALELLAAWGRIADSHARRRGARPALEQDPLAPALPTRGEPVEWSGQGASQVAARSAST